MLLDYVKQLLNVKCYVKQQVEHYVRQLLDVHVKRWCRIDLLSCHVKPHVEQLQLLRLCTETVNC